MVHSIPWLSGAELLRPADFLLHPEVNEGRRNNGRDQKPSVSPRKSDGRRSRAVLPRVHLILTTTPPRKASPTMNGYDKYVPKSVHFSYTQFTQFTSLTQVQYDATY
jgi:hypothetical protein